MPLAHEVRLPKSHVPAFPPQCPGCGTPHPADKVRISTNAIGWWTALTLSFGRRFTIDVPVCDACARRTRRQRRLRFGLFLVCLAVAVPLAMFLLDGVGRPFRKWLGVGTTILLLLPFIFWEVLNPVIADVTAFADDVEYEFTDPEYAALFAEMNGGKVGSD